MLTTSSENTSSEDTSAANTSTESAVPLAETDSSAADSTSVVSVVDFYKTFRVGFFRKKVEAVRGVSFEVQRGEIFGLLGPNGAGKTSTLKSLLRLTFPTSGTIKIFGVSTSKRESMYRVGYMPENPYIYQYLKAPEFLDLCGRLLSMPAKKRKERIEEMIEIVGLSYATDRPIGRFSKGMMQRVGLAQALLHDPELLILDEPMSGLDPIGRKEVRDILIEQRRRGKTLIFTSHILSDVEMLCDRVAILRRGKIQAHGRLRELLVGDDGIDILVDSLDETLAERLRAFGKVEARPSALHLTLESPRPLPKVLQLLLDEDVTLLSVTPHTKSLETFFVAGDKDAD